LARVDWERAIVVTVAIALTAIAARLADRAIARRQLAPEAATRYRVIRQTVVSVIVIVGVLSALLTIPAVRGIATGILASSAVAALIIGFAAQRTLANMVAGVLIALSQPLRIGDRVEVAGGQGVVEEIDLTYTFIRQDDGTRFVIPNDKLASDTIRNFTIVRREKVAEVTVQVPLSTELGPVLDGLRVSTGGEAYISALDGEATIVVRVPAGDAEDAKRIEQDLRLRVHERLRADGVLA
jgi:small-conductance mechanosensitive channel